MRGSVIGFDPDSNTGAISGDDGSRYDFVRADWRAATPPARNTVVDFVPDGRRAIEIHPALDFSDPTEASTAQVIYILYLVSLAVGVTALIGVIMAYVYRSDAPDWVAAHYRYLIRTFWIGLLYGLISVATAIIVVGLLFGVFTFVWWIVRCIRGLKWISQGVPPPQPATWLW
ncbi:MAG: DUF4870 family protein [Thiohalocapsa sp.]